MSERLHLWEDELYEHPRSGLHAWEPGGGLLWEEQASAPSGAHAWEDDEKDHVAGFRAMDSDSSEGEELLETSEQDEFLGGNVTASHGTFDLCQRLLRLHVVGVADCLSRSQRLRDAPWEFVGPLPTQAE